MVGAAAEEAAVDADAGESDRPTRAAGLRHHAWWSKQHRSFVPVEQRQCLRCRQPGHMMADCPQRPAGGASVDGETAGARPAAELRATAATSMEVAGVDGQTAAERLALQTFFKQLKRGSVEEATVGAEDPSHADGGSSRGHPAKRRRLWGLGDTAENGGRDGRSRRTESSRQRHPFVPVEQRQCLHCKQPGHMMADCPQLSAGAAQWVPMDRRNQRGRMSAHCPQRSGGETPDRRPGHERTRTTQLNSTQHDPTQQKLSRCGRAVGVGCEVVIHSYVGVKGVSHLAFHTLSAGARATIVGQSLSRWKLSNGARVKKAHEGSSWSVVTREAVDADASTALSAHPGNVSTEHADGERRAFDLELSIGLLVA